MHSVKLVSRASGEIIVSNSGQISVPVGKTIQVFMVGGGGRVAGSIRRGVNGGGGGYTKTVTMMSTGDLNVSIGGSGGNTIVGSEVANAGNGVNGGSGGGAGTTQSKTSGTYYGGGGAGGSDGSNGGQWWYYNSNYDTVWSGTGGSGQGSTTRAFGEPTGTLYSGGGGGGIYVGVGTQNSADVSAGNGGAGGGGKGEMDSGFYLSGDWYSQGNSYPWWAATDGAVGTGGGAGGPTMSSDYSRNTQGGSGMVLIRW